MSGARGWLFVASVCLPLLGVILTLTDPFNRRDTGGWYWARVAGAWVVIALVLLRLRRTARPGNGNPPGREGMTDGHAFTGRG